MKRTALGFVGLVAILAVLIWLRSVANEWTRFKEDRDGYMGIKLGASMDEAYYVFGVPEAVFDESVNASQPKGSDITTYVLVDGSDPNHRMPLGKTFRDYDFWGVPKAGVQVGLRFDVKTKKLIGVRCVRSGPDDSAQCPWIYGVGPYETEDEIVIKLGPADNQTYQGATKFLNWKRLGLEIRFQKQQPFVIIKNNDGRPDFWWFLTHQVF